VPPAVAPDGAVPKPHGIESPESTARTGTWQCHGGSHPFEAVQPKAAVGAARSKDGRRTAREESVVSR